MSDMNFNKQDVITVAQALVDEAVFWDDGHYDSRNPHDGYSCNFCGAEEYQKASELKHDLDCPVLVAIDLLT